MIYFAWDIKNENVSQEVSVVFADPNHLFFCRNSLGEEFQFSSHFLSVNIMLIQYVAFLLSEWN